MSTTFANTMLPTFGGAIGWQMIYDAGSVVALVSHHGDFNRDGAVDAADYVLWRKTVGTQAALAGDGADGNHNGWIDQGDYLVWRNAIGLPAGAGSGGARSGGENGTPVPEPAAIAWICLLMAFAGVGRHRCAS
jgi:hypothetical protein